MKYSIEGTTLTEIADVIREKTGSTRTIATSTIAKKIGGLTDVSEATLTSCYDVPARKIAFGANGKRLYGDGAFSWQSGGKLTAPAEGIAHVIYHGTNNTFTIWNADTSYYSSNKGVAWAVMKQYSADSVCVAVSGGDYYPYLFIGNEVYHKSAMLWLPDELPVEESTEWLDGVYVDDTYVVVGKSGAGVRGSAGVWTAFSLPVGIDFNAISYGSGVLVCVGAGGGCVYSADKGVTWTAAEMPAAVDWHDVTFGMGKFVAVGDNAIAYSVDGVTWTAAELPESMNGFPLAAVACGDNCFVVISGIRFVTSSSIGGGETYSTFACYSADGKVWTANEIAGSVDDIAYGSGVFMAVGSDISVSADGAEWRSATESMVYAFSKIGFETHLTYGDADDKILRIVDDKLALGAIAGELTFSGTYANATYYTEAGCSLAVDPVKGMAFVTIQGGTSTTYEKVYFVVKSKPDGVEMLTTSPATHFGTGGDTQCHFTAVFTGITDKVDVLVELNTRSNTSYDAVQADITMTYA